MTAAGARSERATEARRRRREWARRRWNHLEMPGLPDRGDLHLLSDEEVAERLLAASGRERLDKRVLEHSSAYYRVCAKWAAQTKQAHGFASRYQIAKQLWPGIRTRDDARKKINSMMRHEQRLLAAGVLHVAPQKGPRGEWRCIYWELIDRPTEPELYPQDSKMVRPAGVAQSVRAAES